jgi:hypothetical protein
MEVSHTITVTSGCQHAVVAGIFFGHDGTGLRVLITHPVLVSLAGQLDGAVDHLPPVRSRAF